MRHSKIINRESGNQFKILAAIFFAANEFRYEVQVLYKRKGGRVWDHVPINIRQKQYRKMTLSERRVYDEKNYLRFVTADEILQAKQELWRLFEPK